MALFVVSYDLIKYKDYPKLWAEFERLGGVKCLESTYLIELNNTTTEVKDHFATFIDGDDKLVVIEFSTKPKFTRAQKGTQAWIDAHFS